MTKIAGKYKKILVVSWWESVEDEVMNAPHTLTSTPGGRPGATGFRDALGPGFAMVAPTEATLLAASGQPGTRRGRLSRH